MPKVTLVDEKDNVIGEAEKVEAHKNPVALHRAISILLFNGDKMLITKRASNKFTWPDYWSNAVCTNVAPDESYQECAQRRLKEELGIEGVELADIFSFIYSAKYNDEFGENELDHTFRGEYDGEFDPDPDEISEYKWVELSDLKEDIKNNPDIYTPWFKIIVDKL